MVRVAVFVWLMLWVAACGSDGGGSQTTSTPISDSTPRATAAGLEASGSGFTICVDRIGTGTALDDDVERVADAIRNLRDELEDRSYADAVLLRLDEAVVLARCPPPAAQDERYRVPDPKTGAMGVIGPRTELPLEHNLRVYFVPEEMLHDWFGDVDYARGVEDMLCSGHQCASGTGGLYLGAGVSDSLLYDQIRRALGFDPELGR